MFKVYTSNGKSKSILIHVIFHTLKNTSYLSVFNSVKMKIINKKNNRLNLNLFK
jgi:hypothetical protein